MAEKHETRDARKLINRPPEKKKQIINANEKDPEWECIWD